MTQPPPYQGGYPQQPDPYGQPTSGSGYGQPTSGSGYGQPTPPPGGYPQQGAPGGFPPSAGGPPSGFPPPGGGPGMPPPKQKSKAASIIGSIAVLVVVAVGYIGVKYFIGQGVSNVADNAEGKTTIAEVGDCTTEFTNKITTDASDVKVVKCDDPKAFFEVVKREDDPEGTDGEKAGDKVCAGTKAADFIYMEKSTSGLDWIICLDPINIETAEYGAIPAKQGDCLSDNQDYFEIVKCDDPKAIVEVLTAEDNPDPSLTDGDSAYSAICDPNSTQYYTSESANDDVGPYDWFLCIIEVTK